MIDLHCHILPGLDDGAGDVAESIEMARLAVADGIRTVAATPHSLNETYRNPVNEVVRQVRYLREVFRVEGVELDLRPGSDAHICARMVERVEAGEAATLDLNGRYILAEFPPQAIPVEARTALFRLKEKGITPVITHPERNLVFQHRLDVLFDLVKMGCPVQITAMSLTGEMGEAARECAHELVKNRLAHVIASDAHSARYRPPIISSAVEVAAEILQDGNAAKAMVTANPAAILTGARLAFPEPRQGTRRKWWKLF